MKNKMWLIPIILGSAIVVGSVLYYYLGREKKRTNKVFIINFKDVVPLSFDETPNFDEEDNFEDAVPVSVFTRSGTRIRKEPNTSSTILATYDAGVELWVRSVQDYPDGTWYLVDDGGDIVGYVRSDVALIN